MHREGVKREHFIIIIVILKRTVLVPKFMESEFLCAGLTTGGEEGPAEESQGENFKKYSKLICSIVMELAMIDKD